MSKAATRQERSSQKLDDPTKNPHVDPAALALAALGGIIPLTMGDGDFDWLATIVGITLVLLLIGWNKNLTRSRTQSAAFATVFGFAFLLTFAQFITWALRYSLVITGKIPNAIWALTWFIGTITLFVVDMGWQRR